jgi:hypothetical protein
MYCYGCLYDFFPFLNDAGGIDSFFMKPLTDGKFFYERNGIHDVSEIVIRVWAKLFNSDEGRSERLGEVEENKVSTTGFELVAKLLPCSF